MARTNHYVTFTATTRPSAMLQEASTHYEQKVFPVVDATNKLVGLVTHDEIMLLQGEAHLELLVTAADPSS